MSNTESEVFLLEAVSTITDLAGALANGERVMMLRVLFMHQSMPAQQVATEARCASFPSSSHNFKILREAGLVQRKVNRNNRIYSLTAKGRKVIQHQLALVADLD